MCFPSNHSKRLARIEAHLHQLISKVHLMSEALDALVQVEQDLAAAVAVNSGILTDVVAKLEAALAKNSSAVLESAVADVVARIRNDVVVLKAADAAVPADPAPAPAPETPAAA